LFFTHGAELADPHKLLQGAGRRVRHLVLEEAATLDKPAVQALIAAALARAARPIDAARSRQLLIKSVLAKQRPRRPASGSGA
jgi:hypothetical protein